MAKEPTPTAKQYVAWKHANAFEERELTASDFKSLGAETASAVKWNADNNFRVERSTVPLNDGQLTDLLGRDRAFVLIEE